MTATRPAGAKKVYEAFMGAGSLPFWATVIDASKRWSIPPWQIANEPEPAARLKWLIRLNVYERELERARKQ